MLRLENITKDYKVADTTVAALRGIDLAFRKNEFVSVLGPSGCGKTTLLNIIGGLDKYTSGEMFINGKSTRHFNDADWDVYRNHRIGFVFQSYNLIPHQTVLGNVELALTIAGVGKAERTRRAKRALDRVGLEGQYNKKPNQLSGGQCQRVAIARALVNEPEVLLLDEPLGALDLKMRKDMQLELMDMHKRLGITFIYVTHDQEEALTMSDKIVVMRLGEIQQIASPEKVYDEPANAFVADFIGESTILSGTMLEDCKVEFCDTVFECVDKGFKHNEPIDVIIRPEDVKIKKVDDKRTILTAEVISSVFKGDHYQITLLANGNEIVAHDTDTYEVGETVGIYIKPFDLHIMHKTRIINEIDTVITGENLVEICGTDFECKTDLEIDTPVKVLVDFDDVEITDDEEDGQIGATVLSSIYKGSYYQAILSTDDHYIFFADTDDDWLKGDRVGIKIAPEKIIIEKRSEEETSVESVVKDETLTKEEQEAIEQARLVEPEKFDAVEERIIEAEQQEQSQTETDDSQKEDIE